MEFHVSPRDQLYCKLHARLANAPSAPTLPSAAEGGGPVGVPGQTGACSSVPLFLQCVVTHSCHVMSYSYRHVMSYAYGHVIRVRSE